MPLLDLTLKQVDVFGQSFWSVWWTFSYKNRLWGSAINRDWKSDAQIVVQDCIRN